MKPNNEVAQKERDIFANNLKYHLAHIGKTQIDLARDLGVTSSTVSDWANAKKYPRVDKMQAVADYLGVLLSDLREDRNKENPALEIESGIWDKIESDPVKLLLANWIADMDQEQTETVANLLRAVRLAPNE